jgi:serine/threonine protein kinase
MSAGIWIDPTTSVPGGAPLGECPTDQVFSRLIEGTLDAERLSALQAHCDVCATCGRTMAELARTLSPDRGDWLGGRYRLLEPLGAGGMGVVYTGFDNKLQRKVAVKRLREPTGPTSTEQLARERRRARVLREAQLLASLSHPNVVTVHDVGGLEGELYVVMELVDGFPMSRWISEARPRPGWREIVDLYLQAGRGLAAAHALGVVHRDVKPENILVARSGRVSIGDFGLAGLAGAPAAPDAAPRVPTGLTETGVQLGTPAYMAPELQDDGQADARSDQFSFCTSLWESLHGRRPFAGETAAAIAAAVRRGQLPLGADGVPRAVDRVLARGLAADPARRHASMTALAAELALACERGAGHGRAVLAVGVVALAVGLGVAVLRSTLPAPPARAVEAPVSVAAPASTPEPVVVPAPMMSELSDRDVVVPPPPVPKPALPRPTRRASSSRRLAVALPSHGLPAIRLAAETDPRLLLFLADSAQAERDGATCLAALDRIAANAWPAALAARVTHRRATCEMLIGSCERGRRLLEPLEGEEGARGALLANCPPASLATIEDKLLAVAEQADEARYAGNEPARRRELRQVLLRETGSPEIQVCLRNLASARACSRRLTILARAYQVVAESFLAAGDCAEGALLDVMQSQVKFRSLEPEDSDPALGCRAQRTADVYRSCAPAAQQAEKRCVARVQAARGEGLSFPLFPR